MKILQRLKCAIPSKRKLKAYYRAMTRDQLKKRRLRERNIYLSASVSWTAALLITLLAARMDGPLLVLYSGTVLAVLISQWFNYRNKRNMIDAELALKQ